MQQHSKIIELKDRLVQALDEQSNVKDINEVNQIISILEQTRVTREDLEKTRLGKFINDLRKRTSDKELAKRAKKLIKTWRDLTVSNSSSSSTSANNISALTSPFNSNSISPHGYSTNVNQNGYNRNSFIDSKLTPPASHHPALLRVKHGSLPSSNEKPKVCGRSLSPALSPVSHNLKPRPQAQNASPKSEMTNGYDKSQSPKNYQKRINLTSPVNNIGSNGLSPGLHNFKNLFVKDGVSPNAYRRRTTPPTPNTTTASFSLNNSETPNSRCSPLAFSFNNESRDSFHNKNSYSNQNSNFDFQDEDSNSSQFSNFSNECGGYSKPEDGSKRRSRKRKIEEDTDTLRENVNYISYGGRRPQSTKELIEKFNVKLDMRNSLSASSSPCISYAKESSELSSKSRNGVNNFYSKNGFHSEENSLDSFESAILQKKRSTVVASPSVRYANDEDDRPGSISPYKFDGASYDPDEVEDDDDDETDHANVKSNFDQTKISLNFYKTSESHSNHVYNISKIDQEIMDIYSKLPKIKDEDIALMKDFKFDDDGYDVKQEEDDNHDQLRNDIGNDKLIDEDQDDPYESFEYEVDEDEGNGNSGSDPQLEHNHQASSNDDSNEASFHSVNSCDIYKCDTYPNHADHDNNVVGGNYDGDSGHKTSESNPNDDDPKDDNHRSSVAISGNQNTNASDDENSINCNKNPLDPTMNKNNDESNKEDEDLESKTNDEKTCTKVRRKCMGKYRVKKSVVDRLANEEWECYNGNYDKDNVWHDFSEMTSSYVLVGGDNQNNTSDENVLHILPYVNCTW